MILIILILFILFFIDSILGQISSGGFEGGGGGGGGGSSFFYYSGGSSGNLTPEEVTFCMSVIIIVIVIFIIFKCCEAGTDCYYSNTYPKYVMNHEKRNVMNSGNDNNNNMYVDLYNNNNNQNWRGFYIGSQDINSKKTQVTCHIKFNGTNNTLSGTGKDKHGGYTMYGFYNKTTLYWNKRYNRSNDFKNSVHYKGTVNNDIGCGITGSWYLQSDENNNGVFAMWCCASQYHMNPGILPTYVSIPSLCIMCSINRISVRIEGCAHACLCNKCSKLLEMCPICDTVFNSTIELTNDFKSNPLFDTISI